MPSIIVPNRNRNGLTRPAGFLEYDSRVLGVAARKVIVPGQPDIFVKGALVAQGVAMAGSFIGITQPTIFSGDVSSEYTIDLGARPDSAAYVCVAERNVDLESTVGIAHIFNTRSGGESPFVACAIGNSFSDVGNKNNFDPLGFVNGKTGAGNTIPTNTPVGLFRNYPTLTGSKYKLFAKDDGPTGGFVSPIKLYLFIELPNTPDEVGRELSRNPWQLFRASPRRLYFDVPSSSPVPTLSAATAINVTSSSFEPRVSYAF